MIVTKLITFYFNPFSLPTLSNVNASQQVFTFTVRPAAHLFFSEFFFQDQDQDHEQDQDFTMKFIGESYSLYAKDIHQIWCRSAKFL